MVIGAFLLPPTGVYLYLVIREMIRTRKALEALKRDSEASAAEGYPPPGPPTTDSLSDGDVD